MTFSISAVSPSGQRFKLFENGTWESDGCVASEKVAFRSSKWGDSIEDVKKVEKCELLLEEPTFLAYRASIAGLSAVAFFNFVEGHLVMGSYRIDQPHADNNAYLSDFDVIKNLLKKKYGPTSASDAVWLNELYKDNYSEWGMAISCGHVSFFEIWDDEETHLELQLGGDNYEVNLALMYRSVALKHLQDAQREKAQLEGL